MVNMDGLPCKQQVVGSIPTSGSTLDQQERWTIAISLGCYGITHGASRAMTTA